MARTFDVPIAIEFALPKSGWLLATARIRGWSRNFRKPSPLAIPLIGNSVLLSEDLAIGVIGGTRSGVLSTFQQETLYSVAGLGSKEITDRYAPNGVFPQRLYGAQEQFPILFAPDPPAGLHRDRDPWQMRDEFLRLKRDDEALLDFANKWGEWDADILFPIEDEMIARKIDDYSPRFIMPDRVWKMQDFYRSALRTPAEDWLTKSAPLSGLSKRSTFPFLGTNIFSCRTAIETTITLDLLKKVKFRVCARRDCDNVFSLDSKHKRKFCQQYCGHLESVRKQRLATQRANAKNS